MWLLAKGNFGELSDWAMGRNWLRANSEERRADLGMPAAMYRMITSIGRFACPDLSGNPKD